MKGCTRATLCLQAIVLCVSLVGSIAFVSAPLMAGEIGTGPPGGDLSGPGDCPCYTEDSIRQAQQTFKSNFSGAACSCDQFPEKGKPISLTKECISDTSTSPGRIEWDINLDKFTCFRDTKDAGGDMFGPATLFKSEARRCFAILKAVCAGEGL